MHLHQQHLRPGDATVCFWPGCNVKDRLIKCAKQAGTTGRYIMFVAQML